MKRKIVLLLILGLGTLPSSSAVFESDAIWYETTSDNTVMVVPEPLAEGEGTSIQFRKFYVGDIEIPETVDYQETTYTVTAVQEGTFRESGKLTSVSLPASLTDLGNAPFAGCPLLSTINVSAENMSFAVVDGLLCDKAVTTLIACPGAKENAVTIPSTVSTIAESAFHGCGNLTEIVFPETVTDIGKHAFQGCENITSLVLPEGITAINDSTFYYCSSLSEIALPESVNCIGVRAFYRCKQLTSLVLPDAVETICDYAFSLCTALKTIQLSASLKTIGYRAFENCSKIKRMNIPAQVSSIATLAFCGCSSLTTINVVEENTAFSSIDGVLYDKRKTTLLCYPSARLGECVLPSSVSTIAEYGFYAARLLEKLELPSSVTTIKEGAFFLCSGMKSIIMPSKVNTLGDKLFVSCTSLKSIVYYAVDPPEISASTFTANNLKVPLYVLERAVDSYKSAEHWQDFDTILPISAENVDGLMADANNDGLINMVDVTQVINYILGKTLPEFWWQRADTNFDGLINMSDVTAIINIILGR